MHCIFCRSIVGLAAAATFLGLSLAAGTTEPPKDKPAPPAKPAEPSMAAKEDSYVLGFTMKSLDGKDVDLASFKGKVVLMVNVASKCGLTPQYEGLQKLYADKKDKGFVILGFPANNFGSQEPGTDKEISEFCTSKYNVTFPMFSKISVKGDDTHPLYKKLIGQPAPIGGEPKWNFTKFLVDRTGHVVARFEPKTKPDDAAVIAKIDELVAAGKQ